MLQIIADNINLNLSEDIQITMIIENPFMVNDRIPTPYTLTFELPATKANLKATKWPNRVTSYQKVVELSCEIKFDSITFSRGILSVDGFEETIKVSFKSISVFDNLRQKLYDIDMKKVEFGVAKPRTPTTADPKRWDVNRTDPTNFAGIYNNTNNRTNTEFVLAPVKIANTQWRSVKTKVYFPGATYIITRERPDLTADEMYFNFWNNDRQKFDIITENTRAFPFPYLNYIFDKVFSDALVDNPFHEGEMAKLVMICPYHPKYYQIPGFIHNEDFNGMIFDNSSNQTAAFTPYYKLNSFLPDVFANEFLKDVLKMFCMSLLPSGDRFRIVKNKDMINNTNVENWSPMLINKLAIIKKDKQTYKYGYSAIKDEFTEIKESNKVNSIRDMFNRPLVEAEGYIADFYINSTGEYFTKSQDENGVAFYNRKASGYGNVTEAAENVYDTVSNISPLPMTIDDYWSTIDPQEKVRPPMGKWYVPEFIGDRMTRGNSVSIMFDRGKNTSLNGSSYPLLSATNMNANGVQVGDLSLAWEGENGLINKFHKEFKDWVEKDKVGAYGEFNLSAKDLKMLDFSKKKHIKGRNFYFEKIQVVIELKRIQPAQIDLIEA